MPYDGPDGIEALLRRLAEEPGFETISEDGRVMGLDGPTSVSLEPGGQVEQNGQPLEDLVRGMQEIADHLGTSSGSVAVTLHRARTRLRQELASYLGGQP